MARHRPAWKIVDDLTRHAAGKTQNTGYIMSAFDGEWKKISADNVDAFNLATCEWVLARLRRKLASRPISCHCRKCVTTRQGCLRWTAALFNDHVFFILTDQINTVKSAWRMAWRRSFQMHEHISIRELFRFILTPCVPAKHNIIACRRFNGIFASIMNIIVV